MGFYQVICRLLVVLYLALLSSTALGSSITAGPIVGGVTSENARVFVRTRVQASVYIEYDTNPSFTNPLTSTAAQTLFRNDLTAILQLHTLLPNTKYYYRAVVNNVVSTSQPYSFVSFPTQDSVSEFSFVAFADVGNNTNKAAPAYIQAALDLPKFMIQLGDWDHRDPQTLSEMRKMHREVISDSTAAGKDFKNHLAKNTPLFHVWDDHDYGMENGDYTFAGKQDAIKAFKEYFPMPDLPNPNAGIWHSFVYAQSELFMLDVRSNRDPNTDPDGPEKSLLNGQDISDGQKEWLFDGLLNSTARWKFIVSGSNFNPTCKADDSWGGFLTEWQEVVDFISVNNISNVIVVSGDLHSAGGYDDGSNSGIPEVSVPNTNLNIHHAVSTGLPGIWSGGLLTGDEQSGYLLVQVLTQPDRVLLQIKSEDGTIRLSITLEAE